MSGVVDCTLKVVKSRKDKLLGRALFRIFKPCYECILQEVDCIIFVYKDKCYSFHLLPREFSTKKPLRGFLAVAMMMLC